ncbi:MAG: clpP [Phycisphaerales bacterium]|nr:clpP [Phycisphaerales bacterium]MDB5355912.1 clpP [Phycisphaerales bacterium]
MAYFDFKGADPRLVARAMEYGLAPQTSLNPEPQTGLYWGGNPSPIPNVAPNLIPGRGPVASPMAMPGPGGAYNRYREMTLEEMLLENRVVFLIGEINHVSASRVIMQMLYLQSVKRDQDINLYINSPGGVVDDTLAMYDIMKFLTCDIATYCIGRAESGGAVVFAAGKKGKRFILPNAKVMIHQPFGGVYGQTADIQIQAEEILKTKNTLINILAKCTGQTPDKIRDDSERDRFFDAQQAVAYGICDEVVGEDSPGMTAEQAADGTKPK